MGKTKKYKHDAECNFDTTVECLVVLVNITMVGDETSHNNLGSIIEKCRNACLKRDSEVGSYGHTRPCFPSVSLREHVLF